MSGARRTMTHAEWTALAAGVQRALGQLPPAELKRILGAGGPGFADQMDAAIAETAAIRERGAALAAPGTVRLAAADAAAAAQIYGHFLRIVGGLAAGTVPHCPHVSLHAPGPAIVVVYAPSADCARCFRRRPRPVLDERESHTCDLCRGYVPGQVISPVLPQCGPWTLLAGICGPCTARLETSQ